MKKVSIIIVNFNGNKDSFECLESVNNLIKSSFELSVIVVDNGSFTQFKVHPPAGGSKFKVDVRIIRSEENLGFAEGNNLGIRQALAEGADFVLLLNNDTTVDKGLVKELLEVIKKDSEIGIVSPKIYFAKGFEFYKTRYNKSDLGKIIWYGGGVMDWENIIGVHRGVDEVDRGQFDEVLETDFSTGCCMLVKKEVFDQIGFFDRNYFLYYEDNDFCVRAKKNSFKIVFSPKAILWHKNAGSAGGSGSSLQDYYITRNRLLFGLKYAPTRSKIALFKESFNLLIKGRKWQRRGVIDFYLRKFDKGSYKI